MIKLSAEEGFLFDRQISKKEYLGTKGLREVILPDTVTEIGDWAFAQCIHLKHFKCGDNVSFGKNVFEGCAALETIEIGSHHEDLKFLLAAVVNKLPAPQLLRDTDIGSKAWHSRFDLSLKAYLAQDDIEGYSDRALCGEEDISTDGIGSVDGELLGETESYVKEISKGKCKLALLRIQHDHYLSEAMRDFLKVYITKNSFGKGSSGAWLAIKEDYRDDVDMLKLFLEVIEPSDEDIDAMIEDLGGDFAQAKSYLISQKNKSEDLFSDLLL